MANTCPMCHRPFDIPKTEHMPDEYHQTHIPEEYHQTHTLSTLELMEALHYRLRVLTDLNSSLMRAMESLTKQYTTRRVVP